MEKVEFIEVIWNKDNVLYSFKGRTPFHPGELQSLGITLENAEKVLEYSYFLTCYQKPYYHYQMIFFNYSDYEKIKDIIEPNKYLKFKEYGAKLKWIYHVSSYGNEI